MMTSQEGSNNENIPREELSHLIKDPFHLRLLIVAGTGLRLSEMREICSCKNLLKLDISSNGLVNLGQISKLEQLRLLYVHNNRLSDVNSLSQIFKCPNLSCLTLFRNPLSDLASLRHYVVNSMPKLQCLDFDLVLDEERCSSLISSSEETHNFFAKKQRIPWPIASYPSEQSLSENQYLSILHLEIQTVSRLHKRCSFILTIQRHVRGHLCRKHIKEQNELPKLAVKYAQKWKSYVQRKIKLRLLLDERKKKYLLQAGNSYKSAKALQLFSEITKAYLQKLRIRKRQERAARVMLRAMCGKHVFFFAFEEYFKISLQKMPKKLLIRADQLHLITSDEFKNAFTCFSSDSVELKPIAMKFFSEIQTLTKQQRSYQVFRLPDSSSMTIPTNPLQSLLAPSQYAKVIRREIINEISCKEGVFLWNQLKIHPFLQKYKQEILIKDKNLRKVVFSEKEKESMRRKVTKIKEFQECQARQLLELPFPHDKILSFFLRAVIHVNQDVDSIGGSQILNLYGATQSEEQTKDKQQQFEENKDYLVATKKEKVIVYFESELDRVSAVIKIQQVWRMYFIRKTAIEEKIEVFRRILENHAIKRIQHWLRGLAFSHKQCFMNSLCLRLATYPQTKQLFLHEKLYLELPKFTQNKRKNDNINNNPTDIHINSSSLFSFPAMNSEICLNSTQSKIFLKNKQQSEKSMQIFPLCLRTLLQINPLESEQSSLHLGDAYHILHTNSKVSRHEINQMRYIRFDFDSYQDAFYRMAALAVKSYSFRCNGKYIALLTQHQILDMPLLLPYEIKLSQALRIQLQEEDVSNKSATPLRSINNISSLFISNPLSMFRNNENECYFDCLKEQKLTQTKEVHMYTLNDGNQSSKSMKISGNITISCANSIYRNHQKLQQRQFQNQYDNADSVLNQSEICNITPRNYMANITNDNLSQKTKLNPLNISGMLTPKTIQQNNSNKSPNTADVGLITQDGSSKNTKNNTSSYRQSRKRSSSFKWAIIRQQNLSFQEANDQIDNQVNQSTLQKSIHYIDEIDQAQKKETTAKNTPNSMINFQQNNKDLNSSFNETGKPLLLNLSTGHKMQSSFSKRSKNSSFMLYHQRETSQEGTSQRKHHSFIDSQINNDTENYVTNNNNIKSQSGKNSSNSNRKSTSDQEIFQNLKEIEQKELSERKWKVEEMKAEGEERRELALMILHERKDTKAASIRVAREQLKKAREGEIIIEEHRKQILADNVRERAEMVKENQTASLGIERVLAQNANFLQNQISSFHAKRNRQEQLMLNTAKVAAIKSAQKPYYRASTFYNNLNSSSISGKTPHKQIIHYIDSTIISDQVQSVNINKDSTKLNGSALPSLELVTPVKTESFKQPFLKRNTAHSAPKDRTIVHTVFPEELYPIANQSTNNMFIFEQNLPLSQQFKHSKLLKIQK